MIAPLFSYDIRRTVERIRFSALNLPYHFPRDRTGFLYTLALTRRAVGPVRLIVSPPIPTAFSIGSGSDKGNDAQDAPEEVLPLPPGFSQGARFSAPGF